MVKIPSGAKSRGSAREVCIRRFVEWWTPEEMRRVISNMDPGAGAILASNGTSNSDKLAGFLYDIVGPRFLRNVDDDRAKRKALLHAILTAAIEGRLVRKEDIIKMAVRASSNDRIRTISDVVQANMTFNMCKGLARELSLPLSVAQKEPTESLPQMEVVEPHTPLNPLYDYQYSTGRVVRDILEGKAKDEQNADIRRILIAVPTGSGKTRMIVETLVTWLNDEKPSGRQQQKKSKFILWVAQSGELCEQAFSTFRSVFESVGKRGTTLHLHPFWGPGGSLPKMGMDDLLDEKGVIVATIQSLYKTLGDHPHSLERLGRLTSCVVVDEAHRSITHSYSSVLRKMGFNWDNRKVEISEWGIVLIGLTATPFRGGGNNEETQRLKRRYGRIHFPTIPYIEDSANYKPHALIDCQTSALAGEDVHILGERSYDRDGFIPDTDYFWNIRRLGPDDSADAASERPDWMRRDEWTLHGDKNVSFKFERPGIYEITLRVVDNEKDYGEASTRIKISMPDEEDVYSESEQQKQLHRRLVKRKILCRVYHHVLGTHLAIDLDANDENHLEKFGEFRSKTLKNIGENQERNDIILNEIVRLNSMGKKKILFFGCNVEHSRRISLYLKMRGLKARYVDSKMSADSRMDAIKGFRESDLDVLCNFGVLTTGFDAPNIDCVFVGRPVRSTLLYTQMIGRGMRGTKSGGTENVLVVDMDDNFQLQDKSAVELGWKIFEPDWERWKPIGAKSSVHNKEPEPEIPRTNGSEGWADGVPEPTPPPEHTCFTCGAKAAGVEDIGKMFGIIGPPEVLAEYLKGGKLDEFSSECYKCRMAAEERGGRDADGRRGDDGANEPSQNITRGEGSKPKNSLTPAAERMFWDRFNYIILDGRKSNTYKFALAAFLLHHASKEDASVTVRYADIAAAFLVYYWHQVIKYNIRQNPHGHHPPRVVTAIRRAFKGCRGELADMHQGAVQRAVSDIFHGVFGKATSKTSLVVPKFQVVYTGGVFVEDRIFYEHSDAKKSLVLRPEALAFLRKNHAALLGTVFKEWAHFLDGTNPPGVLEANVRNHIGQNRVLEDGEKSGEHLGSVSCFACGANVRRDRVRMYHLMPWSYVFESEAWPPVPLCATCSHIALDGRANQSLIRNLVATSQKSKDARTVLQQTNGGKGAQTTP